MANSERRQERPAERGRRWRRRLGAAALGAVLALAAAEVALRVLADHSPVYKVADPRLGYRLRAGVAGVYSLEGRSHYRINRDGWRDVDHARDKPPQTVRIAVLGDSFAEALQVEQEATFWWQLQERLNGAQGGRPPRFEVLNFGVAGYGTAQELLVLRDHVWAYSPDVVLLAFVSGNDVQNNSRALEGAAHRPYFVHRGDGLVLDDSFTASAAYQLRGGWQADLVRWLADHSRLVQLANRARSAWRLRAAAGAAAEEAGVGAEAGLSDGVYREPATPVWREAWRVTESLLVTMSEEVRGRGARFAVCLVSNGIQVTPDEAAQRAYLERHGLRDLSYPNRRVAALGAAAGFAVLDLVPVLAAHAAATGRLVHGFGDELGRGHWNEEGHRVAGEALARWLASLGWW
jgi:lysophospholipase L1-like esterase